MASGVETSSDCRAMLQRVMLRPHSLRNYEKEKSVEMFKKASMLLTSFVPNCFRNYRAKVRESPRKNALLELLSHRRRP